LKLNYRNGYASIVRSQDIISIYQLPPFSYVMVLVGLEAST